MQIIGMEWITVEATAFIALLLIVRRCFGGKMHPLVMKYLWGAAVLRIVLPIRFLVPWQMDYKAFPALPAWAVFVWMVGMLATGLFLFVRNLCFWRNLRSNREIYGRKQGMRVYFVDKRIGSCLAGVWNPDIYISRLAEGSDEWCGWIVKHEISHYEALDHWFGMLRMLALAIQWFNPLVWYGAILSIEDLEIACDYRVTGKADQAEQVEYGECLVAMAAGRPVGILNNITAGTSLSRGSLKRRISRLGEGQEKLGGGSLALLLAMAAVFLLMFCFPVPKSFGTARLLTGIPYVRQFLVQYEQEDATSKEMEEELAAMRQRKKEIHAEDFLILQMDENRVGVILPFEVVDGEYYRKYLRQYEEEKADFIALGEQFVLKGEGWEMKLPVERERLSVEPAGDGYALWYKMDGIADALSDRKRLPDAVVCIGEEELVTMPEDGIFPNQVCLAHENEFEKIYDWMERIQYANQSRMVKR
ncbi:MAG: M56 family metallopeptidase [Clostridium sp.]|nr:M56 family metallopeptidase [Clostridium sp.]